jgi:hypothetical protein
VKNRIRVHPVSRKRTERSTPPDWAGRTMAERITAVETLRRKYYGPRKAQRTARG